MVCAHSNLQTVRHGTQTNPNIVLMLQYLYRLVGVFRNYFGEVEEETIRDNFVIIYELLDETMDHGYPQTTEAVRARLLRTGWLTD